MESSVVKNKNKKGLKANIILILLVILLAIIPLYIAKGSEFEGADVVAQEAIRDINPEYEPWFSPIFKPASGEIESLLFAVQAALGAGIIGYGIGSYKSRKVNVGKND
ncbi:MAG: energy-coupling factor ABC transporter substrate-binding protein [Clostridiales bacterium]|nr:energy-coupling factor ABC transporter substrate-binding protein [Clostridiales bacterium]